MTVLGSEVLIYGGTRQPTGVPRVMREVHHHLDRRVSASGIALVPVTTQIGVPLQAPEPTAYVADDPVLAREVRGPEDVDALMLLEPSSRIDFTRIVRIRQTRRLPVIAMIHDILPIRHPEWFYPRADRDYRVILQQMLRVADQLVVPSAEVREQLLGLGWQIRQPIEVIHLGTWMPQEPPTLSSGTSHHLIYVSTLAPRKGHERLIEAFDALRGQGLDVTLTFVGRVGWCVDDLLPKITEHPEFDRRLRWFRNASDAQLRSLMRGSTIAVVPAEGEGFGLAIEEGLSAGLMVVATDLPVFRERPNPNLLFTESSTEGLVEGIRQAMARTPIALPPESVRTMREFSDDLGTVVVSVLQRDEAGHDRR